MESEASTHDISIKKENHWTSIKSSILSIERESFPEELQFSEEDFQENLDKRGSILLMVSIGKAIAGFLHALPVEELDYLEFDGHCGKNDTLYIVDIAVKPEFRNRGLGTLLLMHLTKSANYSRFTAHAVSSSSKQIFTKAGFDPGDIFEDWIGGRSAVYMACRK